MKKRRIPLWTLPVAVAIVAAIAAPLLWPKQSPSAEPVPTPTPEPVEIAPKPIKTVEPLAMKLPLHQAEVVASKEKRSSSGRSCATARSGGDCRHPERRHGDGSESGESGIDAFPERYGVRFWT